MEDQIPYYDVDEDTHRLLETVLELASLTSNMQLDVTHQQNVLSIVAQVAHRFQIELQTMHVIEVEEDQELEEEQLSVDEWPFDITISNLPETNGS